MGLLAMTACLLPASAHAQRYAGRGMRPYGWLFYVYEAPANITGEIGVGEPGETPTATVQELDVMLRAPVYLKPPFVVTAGPELRWHHFDFAALEFGAIDTYTVSLPVTMRLPISEKWSSMVSLSPSLYTDFTHVSSDDFKLSAVALALYKWRSDTSLAMGFVYSRDFGRDRVYPALGATWRRDHWTVRLLFPRPAIAYAPNDRWRFTAEIGPSGGQWSIADPRLNPSNEQFDFEFSGWRGGFSTEVMLRKWLAFTVDLGGSFSRDYVIDNDEISLLDTEVDPTWGCRTGFIFLR
jgi:hypothetical protein